MKLILLIFPVLLMVFSSSVPKSDAVLSEISLAATAESNGNHPLEIDIVYAFDEDVANQLLNISVDQWFSQKNAFQQLFYGKIELNSFDLIPNSRISVEGPHWTCKGAVMFPSYNDPQARGALNLLEFSRPLITFYSDYYQVEETN